MQLRTFLAKDMKEALTAMRGQMGEDAIIVASETLKDGTVLLRASGGEANAPSNIAPQTADRSAGAGTSAADSRFGAFETRYRENLIARLRSDCAPAQTQRAAMFDSAMLSEILLKHRTPPDSVKMLVEAAAQSGLSDMTLALATALDKSMRTQPFDAGQRGAILLMGPPGAGKTSVAARLAAQHCLSGLAVSLAATDLDTAGQVERLDTFAQCLNVELLRISEPAMLSDAAGRFRDSQGLLIADSGGCDPRGSLPRGLIAFLSAGNVDLVGVLSAAGDAEEAAEIAAALVKLGATRLIVTGLDLSRRKGAVVAIALAGGTIAHVTSSPYLADGLETLTPMALARMLTAGAFSSAQEAA
jgi:flagellar biosynthesis protein FlhF